MASATEVYKVGIDLAKYERMGSRKSFPDEITGLYKNGDNRVVMYFKGIDTSVMKRVAESFGLHAVNKEDSLVIYKREHKLPADTEILNDQSKRIQWYSNNFVDLYPESKSFQHIFDRDIEQSLDLLDGYFRLRYENVRGPSNKILSELASFFQAKGNPDKI